jgi:hypothetical protein
MFRIVEIVWEAGGTGANEDAAGHVQGGGGAAAWVLDGATGLAGREFVPGAASDAAWYARRLSAALSNRSLTEQPLADLFRAVIADIAADYRAAVPVDSVPPYGLPSAAGIWVRRRDGGRLEMAGLGDCRLLFKSGRDAIVCFGGGAADCADEWLNTAVRRLHEGGVTDPAAVRVQLDGLLRAGRAMMNRPGGYWVFSVEPAAADHLECADFGLTGPATLLLVSDGFYRLIDTYGAHDADSLLEAAGKRGLKALYDDLSRIEADDAECHRYPRLKPADDATAMLIEIA